MIKTDNF